MGYIEDMRALIGTRPLILVGAGILMTNEVGHLLLQRRADDGLWGVPGGALEPGETLENAARREVHEETGLTVGAMQHFGVYSGPEQLHTYPNGDEVAIVSIIYTSCDLHGHLQAEAGEVLELRWFGPDALPDAITPPVRPVLRDYQERWRDLFPSIRPA